MTDEAKLIVNTLRECAVATQCSKCVVICEDNECLFTAAAKMIESLSAELEQAKQERDGLSIMLTCATSAAETYKRERDAAVEDMKGICDVCAHFKTCDGPWCGDCDLFDGCGSPCKTCADEGNWQWRGVQEENNG